MLIPSFYPDKMGGSEIQALRLSKKLVTQGWQVVVFTLNTGRLLKHETIDGIEVIRVSGKSLVVPKGLQFLQKRIPLLRRRVKPEILEEYGRPNGRSSYLLARIFYGLCLKEISRNGIRPSLVQINTVEWVCVSGSLLAKKLRVPLLIKDSTVNGLAKLKLMPFVEICRQWIVRHSFFVAISSVIEKELLREGVDCKRIFRISNGIDLTSEVTRTDPPAVNSCLFVGNLYQEPAKGFDILLDAWAMVLKEISGAVLNVVGDGDIPRYTQLVRSKGLEDSIVFWGKQSDLRKFYLSNEIFVLSSIREGMSNSLIEAMSYGLPCVSTMVSGSTDLIENDSSGILVETKNVDALGIALTYLLKNKQLHKSMGIKAREAIERICDLNIVSAQYGEVYQRIFHSKLLQL